VVGGDDQADEECEKHEPQPTLHGPPVRLREQAYGCGDARMLAVAQGRDAADAHQPREQQARDLFRPRNRTVQDMAPDNLQAYNRGLSNDERRDRPSQQAVARG
jgi:hypothetical protein